MSDLHIQLPPEMHAMLRGAAEARHISVQEFIQEVLQAAMREGVQQPPNAVTRKAMCDSLQGKGFRKTTLNDLKREFGDA